MSKVLSKSQNIEKLLSVHSTIALRDYDPATDYKIAQKWWMQHNVAYLARHLLPNLGVVAVNNGDPVCMAWLYVTNSGLSQIAWLVSKPNLGPKVKLVAMFMVIDSLVSIAKNNGYTYIQIMSDSPGFTRASEMVGFKHLEPHDLLFKSIIEDYDDI